jgi:hypothetical protein
MCQITINSYKNLKIFRKSYHVQTMLMETFGKNRSTYPISTVIRF